MSVFALNTQDPYTAHVRDMDDKNKLTLINVHVMHVNDASKPTKIPVSKYPCCMKKVKEMKI